MVPGEDCRPRLRLGKHVDESKATFGTDPKTERLALCECEVEDLQSFAREHVTQEVLVLAIPYIPYQLIARFLSTKAHRINIFGTIPFVYFALG